MTRTNAVGQVSPVFTMDIERGKIREFARATGAKHAAYLDAERPVVPPTFLATQAFWQPEEAEPWVLAGLDTSKGLHAEQEYVFYGPPPRASARLTCQTSISESFQKQRQQDGAELIFVVAVTTFHDEQGRLVAQARATAVEVHPDQGNTA